MTAASVSGTCLSVKEAGRELRCGASLLSELCGEIDKLNDCIDSLSDILSRKPADVSPEDDAAYMRTKVLPAMAALRASADHLERITDRNCWPFPTYDELLFSIQ